MKKKIKVLIADDHAMVRDGLCRVLEDTDDIAVVGQADNGLTALSLAKKTKPDVVVLDYTMPKLDGLAATRRILDLLSKTKILILTVFNYCIINDIKQNLYISERFLLLMACNLQHDGAVAVKNVG